MKKILIVDDEKDICLLLGKFFTKKGYNVKTASNGEEGIAALKKEVVDLVICDFKLPDYNGLEILQKIKIIDPNIQVVIITGYSDVRMAVETLKKGAFDYVTKPLYPDEILHTVEKALGSKEAPAATTQTKKQPAKLQEKKFVVGKSQQSQIVQKHIQLIAPTDMSVIILGETGTGKEYVAKAIHEKSKRKNQPFIAVDCGALPKDLAGSELFGHVKGAFTGALNEKKGRFEMANGGTLFLDEIGNLSYDNQIKLLRVLQERVVKKIGGNDAQPIDVRVLVATNENLKESINKGEFREDIYHRLNEFKIELTALRERPDDIEDYALHFLESANSQLEKDIKGFAPDAMNIFKNYYWHGNLRELSNVVKRAVLLCQEEEITSSSLPPELMEPSQGQDNEGLEVNFRGSIPSSLKAVVEEVEKKVIIEVLRRTNNNRSKTAELLKVDRKTLYNKLSLYNID